mmetsp:Transcript_12724/g.16608  ORF Transcript_12724/g.16608 Transcript_12724/m.16608 type:complete len:804 (+) Transcript_12724:296-2707(+)
MAFFRRSRPGQQQGVESTPPSSFPSQPARSGSINSTGRISAYPGQRASAQQQQATYTRHSLATNTASPPHNPTMNSAAGSGAYRVGPGNGSSRVTRNNVEMSVYRVVVPQGIGPGQEFHAVVGNQMVRVVCPQDSGPGSALEIRLGGSNSEQVPRLGQANQNFNPPAPPPGPFRNPIRPAPNVQQQRTHLVRIPRGIRPGQRFQAIVDGQRIEVTCPRNASGGMQVRINVPTMTPPTRINPPAPAPAPAPPSAPREQPQMQYFEVPLPDGVLPGQPFALMAGGRRVLVTAPQNVKPGDRVRFQLPVSLTSLENIKAIQLTYGKSTGWTRSLKPLDDGRVEFHWARLDRNDDLAFVRQLEYYNREAGPIRSAYVSLVPAEESSLPGNVTDESTGEILVAYQELVGIQGKKLDDKATWLQDTCRNKLAVDINRGHIKINIRRDFLLRDSVDAIMSLSRVDLRRTFRFEFFGEVGIDAGGLMTEWFHLVTQEVFHPNFGLWEYSSVNQMCLNINSASEMSHPDEHLTYFRFLGRVFGKALFERQLTRGHMVRHLYKHLLGFPVSLEDIEMVDNSVFTSIEKLKEYRDNGADVEDLCLDFSISETCLGVVTTKELIPDGAEIVVTNNNLDEYIEAVIKYYLMERTRPQMTELMLGFYDVFDEGLLTIFDSQELELLLCGLPEIDLEDWKNHTLYSGKFEHVKHHKVIEWFWETIEAEFDAEMRAKLLQFVTGTSGVPAQGFEVLQGNDGNIRKFTLHGIGTDVSFFPRAHTCFNRLDLPIYKSREELSEKLILLTQMDSSDFRFDME